MADNNDNKCPVQEVEAVENWDGQEISALHADEEDNVVSHFL